MERSVLERLDDLEHDNNVLRSMQADLQVENTRLALEWEKMAGDVRRLCRTVDDFVGRFSKVN
jgi:hypothetical protein